MKLREFRTSRVSMVILSEQDYVCLVTFDSGRKKFSRGKLSLIKRKEEFFKAMGRVIFYIKIIFSQKFFLFKISESLGCLVSIAVK